MSTQHVYYCLPRQPFELTTFIDSNVIPTVRQYQTQNPGLLTVKLPYPDYSGRSEFPLVSSMSFEAICELDLPGKAVVNPVRVIDENKVWKQNAEDGCEYGWEEVLYDDSHWDTYTASNPYISRMGRLMCWRGWMDVKEVNNVTSIEMKIRHSCRVSVWINEELVINSISTSDRTWMTVTFQSTKLHNGLNLVAILLRDFPRSHHWMDATENKYFLFRCVFRLTTESSSCARAMDLTVNGDGLPGHDPSNLVSKVTADYWKSNFINGRASASFTMKYNSRHVINKYCVTSSLENPQYDPVLWKVWFQIDKNWILVSSQSKVVWTSRLQTQCFVIPRQQQSVSAVLWRVESVDRQPLVQASRFTFYSLNMNVSSSYPLHYDNPNIDAFLNVPIVTVCPQYPYFDAFSVKPDLPHGLAINSGTGCITGSVSESFPPNKLTISATNMENEVVNEIISISFMTCEWPSSTLRISLIPDETPSSEMEVLIGLFNSEWIVVRSSTLRVSSEEHFTHCFPLDAFRIMIMDQSCQGDLHSKFYISQDNRLLAKGRVNPGFPQIWTDLIVRDDWKESVSWYFSFNGTPEQDWFKRIKPSWETWKTAIPGEFPQYNGIAQYFKTVMVLSEIETTPILNIFITIHAGFVLYLNGQEFHRWNVPDGDLTSETLAVSCYEEDIEYKITVPLQFSPLKEGNNVIAVELHECKKPQKPRNCTFRVGVLFGFGTSQSLLNAEVIDLNSVSAGSTEIIKEITDGNYYSVFSKNVSDRFFFIHLFSENGVLEFVSRFSFFFGDLPGSSPRDIILYGRKLLSLQEMNLAKLGHPVESREWVKLLEVTNMEVFSLGLGKLKDFPFYNECVFNEFRFEFRNFEIEAGLEVAEIEFWNERIEGFCDIREIGNVSVTPDFTFFIPSYNWYLAPCPSLYSGSIDHYCYEGNWTDTRNLCRCNAPAEFHYPVEIWYIEQNTRVSIMPVVKGAEVVFFALGPLPNGLVLDDQTGEIFGEVNMPLPLVNIEIEVVNLEGSLVTTLGIMTVSNYEMMLVMIAVVMVVFLILLLLLITRLLHKKTKEMTRGNTKLNVEILPDSLRSLLL